MLALEQYWSESGWVTCAKGTKVGGKRTERFAPVTAQRVRVAVDTVVGRDSVSIAEFELLDADGKNVACPPARYTTRANARGGKAYFAPAPTAEILKAMLDDALDVYDVRFESDPETPGGNLSYIHKVVEGRDVYFFGNSSDKAVDTHVRLRGRLDLEAWDPHTGKIGTPECTQLRVGDQEVTRVRFTLPPVCSVFFVSRSDAS